MSENTVPYTRYITVLIILAAIVAPAAAVNFTPPSLASSYTFFTQYPIELNFTPPPSAVEYTFITIHTPIKLNITPPPPPQENCILDRYQLIDLNTVRLNFTFPSLSAFYTYMNTPTPTPTPTPAPTPPPEVCGNGVCGSGEGYSSCPKDCPAVCGNGACESPDETAQNCLTDCHCGNGVCEANMSEAYSSCKVDCPPVCGNDVCESPDEDNSNCASDCRCGNGVCEANRSETYSSCKVDCPAVCGNGACESPDEGYGSCPADCSAPATPAPVMSGTLVGDVTFDKESYSAGDAVVAGINVQNTGNVDITSETVTINAMVTRLDDWRANRALDSMSESEKSQTFTMDFTQTISSGTTGTVSARFQTQKNKETSIGSISLSGDYTVSLAVSIGGISIGSKQVSLTLH
jgi:hypothetical protein